MLKQRNKWVSAAMIFFIPAIDFECFDHLKLYRDVIQIGDAIIFHSIKCRISNFHICCPYSSNALDVIELANALFSS